MSMRRPRRLVGFALVAVSLLVIIPPVLVVFPSLIQWLFGTLFLGLSQKAWQTLMILAWISGASLVGGIWIIKNSN